MHPLISIITVTRNARNALKATLESVKGQSCDLYEQIVVDGASTDGTQQAAHDSGIKQLSVVSEPDRGIYDAMNKGLSMASGDYVMFLNAGDTLATPDTLQLVADAIMDDDYPGIVYGQTRIVSCKDRHVLGERHLQAPPELTLDSFAQGMVVCHQAFIALRKLVPNFNLHYRYSADYEWCIKVLQRSKRNAYIPRVIVDYAASGETTSHRYRSLWERFSIMVKYYGLFRAVKNHVSFIPRFLRRQCQERRWEQ